MKTPIRFDLTAASDQVWEQLLKLQQSASSLDHPADPPLDPALVRKSIEAMGRDPQTDYRIYLAIQANRVVGRFSLSMPTAKHPHYSNSRHVAFAHFLVLPAARRQGIGRAMLQHASAECQQCGITLVQAESKTAPGNAFAEAFGGIAGSLVRESRLALAAIDWSLVGRWASEGKNKKPKVAIDTFAGLISDSDQKIAQYARLYTEIINQTNFAELEGTDQAISVESLRLEDNEHQRMGMHLWTKVSREADGVLSGLTEINYHPAQGARVRQGVTGVRGQYRGRGLGKLLKADMLLFIRQQFPAVEYISTTNANANELMLSINDRLGFRFHQQRTVYKFDLAQIKPASAFE